MQLINPLFYHAYFSPSVKLKLSSVDAIEGCYVPVANWRNESSKTNLDQNDAVAVWATLETVFYFLF